MMSGHEPKPLAVAVEERAVNRVGTSEAHSGLVEVRGLRKVYDGEGMPVRALRGVDLSVAAGSFLAVVGPSGSGKSSLLNLIAGLDVADEGEIVVAGQSLTTMDSDSRARFRRRHMGVVFQFFNLLDGLTVLENVALPVMIAGGTRRTAERRAGEVLDLLGLVGNARSHVVNLSGGQRQRTAIARAIVNTPTVLIADEPTGALDSAGVTEVIGVLRDLRAGGQTIILVTHDHEVAEAADEVVTLRDGQVVGPDSPIVSRATATGAQR